MAWNIHNNSIRVNIIQLLRFPSSFRLHRRGFFLRNNLSFSWPSSLLSCLDNFGFFILIKRWIVIIRFLLNILAPSLFILALPVLDLADVAQNVRERLWINLTSRVDRVLTSLQNDRVHSVSRAVLGRAGKELLSLHRARHDIANKGVSFRQIRGEVHLLPLEPLLDAEPREAEL